MSAASRSSVVKVPKAGELVAANLRRKIITGELTAGQPLPNESTLMEEFGVSRPTLREAFRILESESIITVLRGARGGARVLEPDGAVAARYTGLLLQYQGTPLVDVYRARAEIEVSAIGSVPTGRARDEAVELETLAAAGADIIADADAFARHSARFHLAIVESAGNSTLAVLASILFEIIETHNEIFIATHPSGYEEPANRAAHRAYVKLAKLIGEGDIEAAQRHWRRHHDAVEKFMVADPSKTLVEVLT